MDQIKALQMERIKTHT